MCGYFNIGVIIMRYWDWGGIFAILGIIFGIILFFALIFGAGAWCSYKSHDWIENET